jgi:hypothetical protein
LKRSPTFLAYTRTPSAPCAATGFAQSTTAGRCCSWAGDLANFLRERRAKGKCPLKPNEMYCLRCREAREPAFGDVEYLPATPSGGNLRGLCPACSTLMHRRVSLARMHLMPPEWQATVRQGQERIRACYELSLKCDLDRTPKP